MSDARGRRFPPAAPGAGGQSTDLLCVLIDSTVDYSIILLDAQGHVASWNPGVERLHGYRAEEIAGRHFSLFYPDGEFLRDRSDQDLAIAVAEGRHEDEGWRVRKDGGRFWANVVITALRAPDGRLLGFGKVTRDLTDKRRAEELLRESEQRLRLLIDSVVDYAILMLDVEGRVTSWSTGAELIKGYRADEIIGRHFSMFYPEEDIRAGKPQAELEVAAAEGRFEDEGWRVRKDGSRFWADVIVTPLRGHDGTLRGFGKVTRDLTERKRADDALRGMLRQERELAQRLRELDQMKSEFVEIVAHDLRSPLVVISGFADLLLRKDLPDEQRHEAAIAVSESAKNLAALVDDVLDVALLDSGELKFDLAPFDMVELCAELVHFFQPPGRPDRLSLRADSVAHALGDRHRTGQVVSNLVANALKFSPESAPVEVEVTAEGGEVVVSVTDQGPGVAEEDMPKLFERFSRISPAGSPAQPGTGLGLYIAKSIVEAQGGRIWAESEVGRGSAFYFSLPTPP